MSAQPQFTPTTKLEHHRINADAIQSLDDVKELIRLMDLHVWQQPAERLDPIRHLLMPPKDAGHE